MASPHFVDVVFAARAPPKSSSPFQMAHPASADVTRIFGRSALSLRWEDRQFYRASINRRKISAPPDLLDWRV
jgi:hypothetical protein